MNIFRLGFLSFTLLDFIDILIVAVLLYQLYRVIKGTAAIYIFAGITLIYLFWMLVKAMHMQVLSTILGQVIGLGALALIIVFQQEIRKFLILIGTNSFLARQNLPNKLFSFGKSKANSLLPDKDAIIKACRQMSKTKTGAILVIERNVDLSFFSASGDLIDATISRRLIESIFYKGSPMHDGAVIIAGNRIKAARCVLPISENPDLPARLGMRHRAALGITEQSDAVVVTVSEETGEIAFAKEGELEMNISPEILLKRLDTEFN